MRIPTSTDSIIDSRDIAQVVEEWESDIENGLLEETDEEYVDFKELNEEGEATFADWGYGVTLVADWYFEDYARDLADDLAPSSEARHLMDSVWPFNCIDWEEAADLLKQDYTSITFDGSEYWGR